MSDFYKNLPRTEDTGETVDLDRRRALARLGLTAAAAYAAPAVLPLTRATAASGGGDGGGDGGGGGGHDDDGGASGGTSPSGPSSDDDGASHSTIPTEVTSPSEATSPSEDSDDQS